MTHATASRPIVDRHAIISQVEPAVRMYAQDSENNRTLHSVIHQALIDARLFKMFVPVEVGGLGLDVVTGFEILEEISRIDSAAGWTLQIAAAPVGMTALFEDDTVRELFSDDGAVTAGGFFPPGVVQRVDGGFTLNGRWSFVSGCHGASWMLNPAMELADGAPVTGADGAPVVHLCLYPAAQAEIVDTWNSLGMRGTGSHDVVASDVFIPARHTTLLRPMSLSVSGVLDRQFVNLGVMPTILGNAVVALGVARAAVDESLDLVRTKTPAHFQTPPGQRSTVQAHLGRAEATLMAARCYFFQSLERAWQAAALGPIDTSVRKDLQLAASYAAESAAHAADYIHAAVGSSGVLEDQFAFARHFRDVHTITQHALCSATRFESMGQVMLGMETDWALFNI